MNNIIKSFLVIFSVLLIASCSGGGWSKTDQTEFMDNCVIGATGSMTKSQAEEYCDCVLDDLMDDYDTAEDALSADLYSYAVECVSLD